MENTTIINYVEAAFLLQQMTDPQLQDLRKMLIDEMVLELSEPDYITIQDRVEQLIELGRTYDLARLEAFINQQKILPLFVQDGTGYYQVTKELDNAITIFFEQ